MSAWKVPSVITPGESIICTRRRIPKCLARGRESYNSIRCFTWRKLSLLLLLTFLLLQSIGVLSHLLFWPSITNQSTVQPSSTPFCQAIQLDHPQNTTKWVKFNCNHPSSFLPSFPSLFLSEPSSSWTGKRKKALPWKRCSNNALLTAFKVSQFVKWRFTLAFRVAIQNSEGKEEWGGC